jgi:hypothetical protein
MKKACVDGLCGACYKFGSQLQSCAGIKGNGALEAPALAKEQTPHTV